MTDKKKKIARELDDVVQDAHDLAEELGLKPYEVNYWVVDQSEMNELIAYDGFQTRYPHWRFGMKYDRQRKQRQFLGGKAFEIVNNDNPAAAFLQKSNSISDQKAVITHVTAHSDFFRNNQWFQTDPDAAAMLERNAKRVEDVLSDSDIGREEVEEWIDHCLCIEDNIDQYKSFFGKERDDDTDDMPDIADRVEDMDIDESVKREIFDEDFLEEQADEDIDGPIETDLLKFFLENGKQYDEEEERAVPFEDWQQEILEIIREEAYYFAPQKMTKTCNEGWAALWESRMMTDEGFAGEDEFIEYSDHMSMVLGSPGFNPYKLGMELWEYVEKKADRREVVKNLLKVDGITPNTFIEKIDFAKLNTLLSNPRSDKPWERHYSLARPSNRGFIKQIPQDELEEIYRYLFDTNRFDSVEEAVDEVDHSVGWNRLFDERSSNNDITLIDKFLDSEFLRDGNYFTYEYDEDDGVYRAASFDPSDVKQKLLLQFTNFGKPTITVGDDNYKNKGYLLLRHEYNGIMLDLDEAQETLKRLFELWGRPVYLKTIVKTIEDDSIEEEGRLISYDGDGISVSELDWDEVENIAAEDLDYSTRPDEWTG